MRKHLIVFGILAAAIVAGCETQNIVYVAEGPPARPSGVRSVTADEAVYLYWNPNGEYNLESYRIYRGFAPTGHFDFLGETTTEAFVDYDVINGETYYYAVSSVNTAGLESELSIENVHDTPRPEGYDESELRGSRCHRWHLRDHPQPASVDEFEGTQQIAATASDILADAELRVPNLTPGGALR